MNQAHLAIDLGASSGRAMVATLAGDSPRVELEELHRFTHEGVPTPTGPVWDLTGIWRNVLHGLAASAKWARDNGAELTSVGVDTWGVDWALLGKSGELLTLPHCYRDPANDAASERVIDRLGGFDKLYARTGIQRMPFNTLFPVALRHEHEPRLFDAAERLVFLPDLLHFWLSGEVINERSIASTSSMLDVESGEWDTELLESLGLPTHLLGDIVEPGTVLGELRAEVAAATGAAASVKVIAPASHDTASAVAAVPATGQRSWAYLSCGTWSLLGAELAEPIATDAAREVPFTNERGPEGTIRFLKNIGGLWLVQELQRDLEQRGETYSFAELAAEARKAEAGRTLVDPNHEPFGLPGDFLNKLQAYARDTSQVAPETAGQATRCCLESLALSYAQTLDQLERVRGQSVEVLHMVGGGVQNELLCELTAESIGRPTIIGPTEATAVGNALVQAIGCGRLQGLAELREVVANSFDTRTIEASGEGDLRGHQSRFDALTSRG